MTGGEVPCPADGRVGISIAKVWVISQTSGEDGPTICELVETPKILFIEKVSENAPWSYLAHNLHFHSVYDFSCLFVSSTYCLLISLLPLSFLLSGVLSTLPRPKPTTLLLSIVAFARAVGIRPCASFCLYRSTCSCSCSCPCPCPCISSRRGPLHYRCRCR